jgi:predicted acyltransferase
MENSLRRIASIDVFRALTMLLMIFVNDFWTLTGIPDWLQHSEAHVDFLGFSDIIFPCFLFIVGMSIPFAIKARIARGENNFQIIQHILLRSLALLVMGVFTVNIPEINAEATGISQANFQVCAVIGFFLIWNVYPKSESSKKYLFNGLQLLGVGVLLFLAYKFRGGEGGAKAEIMKPHWWGILGLIGWTYLTCAIFYLFLYKSISLLIISWVFFNFLSIAGHAGWLRSLWPGGPEDWILGNGAFAAFTFSGILATILLERFYTATSKTKLSYIYIGIGAVMLIFGFFLRKFFIISKIYATPTWVFICCGIAFITYALIYWLTDLQHKAHWFAIIKPAGTSTLTCYLVPYIVYSFYVALPVSLSFGIVGLIKSMVFALLIIGITALLGRIGIKLKI